MIRDELHDIAARARRILEDYSVLRAEDFGHPERSQLNHCCGIAAWFLCRQLWRIAGVEALLVYGYFGSSAQGLAFGGNHCWTIVDHLVVDITATQFAGWYRPVEIVPLEQARDAGYIPELAGAAAYEQICCWTPGPLFTGPLLGRYADRREKTTFNKPRPLRYGAPRQERTA